MTKKRKEKSQGEKGRGRRRRRRRRRQGRRGTFLAKPWESDTNTVNTIYILSIIIIL